MLSVLITTGSLFLLFVIWLNRIGKILNGIEIFKNIITMVVDVTIFVVLLNIFGFTNFALQTSALLNVLTTVTIKPLMKKYKIFKK